MAKPPTCLEVDNALDAETLAAATQEAIVQLKRTMEANPVRTVKSLTRREIENVASGAVGAWIKKRSEQHARGVAPGSFAEWLLTVGVPRV